MVRSWRNAPTRKVWEGERPNRFSGLDFEAAVDLHKLKGDRRGQWAMTVNGPWRICFEFRKGDAYDVEITDYHKG